MNRREFLSTALGAGTASAARAEASEAPMTRQEEPAEEAINPYFLKSGDLSPRAQEQVEDYILLQQEIAAGGTVATRGGDKPMTFRFIHWNETDNAWVWPNQITSELDADRYSINAQILGFRARTKNWGDDEAEGNITVEFRGETAPDDTEDASTSLYSRPFDVLKGVANIGTEYIGERDGQRFDLISHGPEMKLRIQLYRLQKKGGFLKTVLQVAGAVAGVGAAGPVGALMSALPAIRIPYMTPEAVTFAQGVFGASADQKAKPVWESAFNTYSLSADGSRLKLTKGLWVAIDEEPGNLTGIRLDASQGKYLLRDGANKELDANYLVLDFQIEADPAS